jgi:hypothetical protein
MCKINDGYLYVHQWDLAALRDRVLRALVFLGSLTRKTGRCAPDAHDSFALPLLIILYRKSLKVPVWEKIRELLKLLF